GVLAVQAADRQGRYGLWGFQTSGGARCLDGCGRVVADHPAVIADRRDYRQHRAGGKRQRQEHADSVWAVHCGGGLDLVCFWQRAAGCLSELVFCRRWLNYAASLSNRMHRTDSDRAWEVRRKIIHALVPSWERCFRYIATEASRLKPLPTT